MTSIERKAFEKTLAEGSVKVVYGRIMLLGSGGVGKTSLRRGLMRLPFEEKGNSTIVAELHSVRPIKQEMLKSGTNWEEITNEDEIIELAQLLKLSVKHSQCNTELVDASTLTNVNEHFDFEVSELKRNETSFEVAIIVNHIFEAALKKSITVDVSDINMQPILHLWDCGGQPVFLEVLPAFLTSRTMFLVMFDASRDLGEKVPSVQYEQGRRVNVGVTNITTLELMERWMANIHAYLVKKDKNGIVRKYPQIAVIGSRRDKLILEKCTKIIHKLCSSFKTKSFDSIMHIRPIIIDNKTAGTQQQDEGYEELKNHIDSFVNNTLKFDAPITWVLFRNAIKLLVNESCNHNVMNISAVEDIADHCKIKREDVVHVLKFYHELGVFLYYPHLDGFKDKIILDPKWFVDNLGKVLTLPGHGKDEQFHLSSQWNHLHTTGILVESLYSEVWAHLKDEGINPEEVMQLLVSFHLAAPADGVKDGYKFDERKKFFVPCVLKYLPPQSSSKFTFFFKHQYKKPCIAPIHITFEIGYVLPGFFVRFVAVIAENDHFSLSLHQNVDVNVYHDLVNFNFGDSPICFVSLHDIGYAIEVQISCTSQNCSFSQMKQNCNNLMKILKSSCEIVDKSLHSRGYAGFDDDDESTYVVDIKRDIKVLCQDKKCRSQNPHYLTTLQHSIPNEISCSNRPNRQIDPSEAYWLAEVSHPLISDTSGIPNKSKKKTTNRSIPSFESPRSGGKTRRKPKLEEKQWLLEVASPYQHSSIENKPSAKTCWKILKDHDKSTNWYEIGTVLDIPYSYREELRKDISRDASAKLEDVLIKWFEKNPSVTWEMFKNALEDLQYRDCIDSMRHNKQQDSVKRSFIHD